MNIAEFESQPQIKGLYQKTIEYLTENPPTVGHGFSHFIQVARNSYKLAEENSYPDLLIVYVCGLLHDIYRPAMGQAGREDHGKKAARVAKEILAQTELIFVADSVANAISDHDEQIMAGNSDLLGQILSIADKQDMSFQRVIAYTYASNNYLRTARKPVFTSFLETMRDFTHYQVKAWKVFLQTEAVAGRDLAIRAYLVTNRDLLDAVEGEIEEKITFVDEVLRLSRQEARVDKKSLIEFGATTAQIKQITSQYRELFQ